MLFLKEEPSSQKKIAQKSGHKIFRKAVLTGCFAPFCAYIKTKKQKCAQYQNVAETGWM